MTPLLPIHKQLIEAASRRMGSQLGLSDVEKRIEVGAASVLATDDAVLVWEVADTSKGKAVVVRVAGGKLDSVLKLKDALEAAAKKAGYRRMLTTGRLGWSRVLRDWRVVAVTMEKEI